MYSPCCLTALEHLYAPSAAWETSQTAPKFSCLGKSCLGATEMDGDDDDEGIQLTWPQGVLQSWLDCMAAPKSRVLMQAQKLQRCVSLECA